MAFVNVEVSVFGRPNADGIGIMLRREQSRLNKVMLSA